MSLIAHYKLDGNALDSSGNGLHGAWNGTTSYTTGKIGQAGNFNGSSTVSFPNVNTIKPVSAVSISLWFNTSIINDNDYLLLVGRDNANGYALRVGSNSLYGWVGSSQVGTGISANITYHAVLTYRSGIGTRLYLNGVLSSTGPSIGTIPYNEIYGGPAIGGHGSSLYYFNGMIDDVRIYDHALSEKEIKELTKAKILHYDFDDFQEPTENIVTNTNLETGWSMGYNKDILWNDISPPAGVNSQVVSFVDSNGDGYGYWYCYENYAPQAPSTTYTISVYARTVGSDWAINAYTADNSEIGRQSTNTLVVPGDGLWHRLEFNPIFNPADSQSDSLSFYFPSIPAEQRCWLSAPQMEAKDHATPFVNGIRTGLVKDISGYENNAVLDLNTTPEWTDESRIGSGAYRFNGTTEYIDKIEGNVFIEPEEITVSGWVKMDTDASTARHIWLTKWYGYSMEIEASTRIPYFRLNGPGDIRSSTALTVGTWHHFAGTYSPSSGGAVYLDGNLVGTKSANGAIVYSRSYPLNIGRYSGGVYFDGQIDDVRIYATALSADDVKELYQTRASIDDKGNLFVGEINETGHKPLLMDYTAWVNGTSNSTAGNMGTHGSQNRIVIGSDPWGKEIPLWESYGIDNTTTNSGIYGGYNSIDNTKLYRMSWWEKRISNGDATYGRYYAGLNGSPSGVWNLSSDTYNTNPYFWSTSRTGLLIGEWFLVVGHVWPFTYTGGINHKDSGRWRLDGSKIGDISQDFRSGPETTILRSRNLSIYQGNDGGLLHHTAYPRMDLCDGTEPSIAELLSGFDSNYIEYVREKGGTAGISLNVGNKDTYLGEINEIGLPIRYIRETMVGSSANAGNHWVEIQAFNSSDVNIALGKTAVSSLLTDGNTASSPYYSTGPATVDLGDVYLIDYLKIWHYYADARTYYKIKTEVSADNINWITVFDSDIDGQYVETSAGKEIILYPNKASIREDGIVLVKELNEGF